MSPYFLEPHAKHNCTRIRLQYEKGHMMWVALKSIQILSKNGMLSRSRRHSQCSCHRNLHPLTTQFHLRRLVRISSDYQFDAAPNTQHYRHISLVLYPAQNLVEMHTPNKFLFHLERQESYIQLILCKNHQ